MSQSFDEWQKSQNLELTPSKRKQIELLFEEIEKAQNKGVKICHILNWLNQSKKLNISQDYLNNTLYRIRKKRNNKSNLKSTKAISKAKTPSISSPDPVELPSTNKEANPYDLMLGEYMKCKNQVDRYVALGGKREEIKDKNISTQRSMVMNLRNQLRQKYKGIY
ncbi:TPA: hypothetical protein ACMDP5_003420 [Vibrio cholerae]|nr:hypothetical protein [Vibrio cholerae]HDZ9324837.1 hypothetical protein [Vibrio cholerae]